MVFGWSVNPCRQPGPLRALGQVRGACGFVPVIPEGKTGPVKPLLGVVIFLFGFSDGFWARRAEVSGSRIGR